MAFWIFYIFMVLFVVAFMIGQKRLKTFELHDKEVIIFMHFSSQENIMIIRGWDPSTAIIDQYVVTSRPLGEERESYSLGKCNVYCVDNEVVYIEELDYA
jgi:hypothetical protein